VSTFDDLRRLWWLLVLFGVVTLGVCVFLVASPHETLSTSILAGRAGSILIGIALIFRGTLFIATGWMLRGASPDTSLPIHGG
jgi:uncharacterized membrane protein HdeD (DUF308 family)